MHKSQTQVHSLALENVFPLIAHHVYSTMHCPYCLAICVFTSPTLHCLTVFTYIRFASIKT